MGVQGRAHLGGSALQYLLGYLVSCVRQRAERYGLKWNPFSTELPSEALYLSPKINDFFWRIENVHVREGGFALIQGDPGTGKSVVLRALAERLERQTDLTVGILNHP